MSSKYLRTQKKEKNVIALKLIIYLFFIQTRIRMQKTQALKDYIFC